MLSAIKFAHREDTEREHTFLPKTRKRDRAKRVARKVPGVFIAVSRKEMVRLSLLLISLSLTSSVDPAFHSCISSCLFLLEPISVKRFRKTCVDLLFRRLACDR